MAGNWQVYMSKHEQKITRPEVESIYWRLQHYLGTGVAHLEIMGSYKRKKPYMGDLDVYVEPSNSILQYCQAGHARIRDIYKAVFDDSIDFTYVSGGDKHITLKYNHPIPTQIDLYFFRDYHRAPASLFLTGSGKHNMALRSLAKSKGYKLNQYGLWQGNTRIDDNTEEGIYKALGISYIAPEDRKDGSEIKNQYKGISIHHIIKSSDGTRHYTITNGRCNCLGFKYRHNCKHIKELQAYE